MLIIELAFFLFYLMLLSCAALSSGLVIGLLGINPMQLRYEIKTAVDQRRVERLLWLLERHHTVLVTLLFFNALCVETMPVILVRWANGPIVAIYSAMVLLFAGEILPNAICTCKYQISIAMKFSGLIKFLVYATTFFSYPIGLMLNNLIGPISDERKRELIYINELLFDPNCVKKRNKTHLPAKNCIKSKLKNKFNSFEHTKRISEHLLYFLNYQVSLFMLEEKFFRSFDETVLVNQEFCSNLISNKLNFVLIQKENKTTGIIETQNMQNTIHYFNNPLLGANCYGSLGFPLKLLADSTQLIFCEKSTSVAELFEAFLEHDCSIAIVASHPIQLAENWQNGNIANVNNCVEISNGLNQCHIVLCKETSVSLADGNATFLGIVTLKNLLTCF